MQNDKKSCHYIRTQRDILDHAWTKLLPGGALFYVTCALNREENEKQMAHFLERQRNTCLLEEEKMFLPVFPGQDALFLAILRRQA